MKINCVCTDVLLVRSKKGGKGAVLPPYLKMKQKKRQRGIIAVLSVILLVAVGIIGFGYMTLQSLQTEKKQMQQEMEANQQTVYVATRLIERGETIIAEGDGANVELQNIYTGLESFNYITEEELGNVATVDISEGVPVMYVMVTDKAITNDSRDYELSAVNLTTDQDVYDVVDVRILFPDGSDYVVLAKKEISQLSLANCVFSTILNEEEILRYACAIIDAYTTTGAKLYTTRYVEGSLQEAATPNYPVREATRILLQTDPNVVSTAADTLNEQARKDLEKRLGAITPEELDAINNGMMQDDANVKNTISQEEITDGE